MALFESFTTEGGNSAYVYGDLWQSQTFTIGTTGSNDAHTIEEIHLWCHRQGSPGTLTVSIRAVDGSGHPTGADLSSGTINGNTFDLYGPIEETITMSSYELQPSTKYAIVIRALAGDGSNLVLCRYVGEGSYSGGNWEESSDAGVNWSDFAANDFMFAEYGTATAPPTIAGTTDGVSSNEGILAGTGALSGTVDSISSNAGILAGTGSLQASSDSVASNTGILKGIGNLVASISPSADVSATLQAVGSLIAQTDSVASDEGILKGKGGLSASINPVADVGGVLGGLGDLQGSVITYSEISGTLYNSTPTTISGISNGIADCSAALSSAGQLQGIASSIADCSAILSGIGGLAGESNGIATAVSNNIVYDLELLEGDSIITTTLNKISTITLILEETSEI